MDQWFALFMTTSVFEALKGTIIRFDFDPDQNFILYQNEISFAIRFNDLLDTVTSVVADLFSCPFDITHS